ncbi:Smr/MutS family protein [Alisedimentitalea sp. MJ-SS2]|uniref:Smr/MutS family protein n=1 Tax=Aliisedimentitalea sp. MJ-SS2 TaxID=3049795 RepID=UPI0029062A0D|nr:Smr/MutS family protein [Alisedimentitalea sp. MJ-SS2]MDU8927957.1 Smr/MutS family protein [Alisedimentitalea sp. MJ-SS2]
MTRRRLSPEEVELWRKVTQTADRLHPERAPHPAPLPKPKPKKRVVTPVASFTVGVRASTALPGHDLSPPPGERLARTPLKMDRKTHAKMKRGKMAPEGKLDLHGMTMDQAHPRLTSFILRAQAEGKRLVLVVTGKGKHRDDGGPIPVRHGVLRHQVPQWLSLPPLAQAVLQVAEAHVSHGGGGAYYVYLRRNR